MYQVSKKLNVVLLLVDCFGDGERSLVVDAVALLGGNEYLVQQMIDKLVDTNYRYIQQTV